MFTGVRVIDGKRLIDLHVHLQGGRATRKVKHVFLRGKQVDSDSVKLK